MEAATEKVNKKAVSLKKHRGCFLGIFLDYQYYVFYYMILTNASKACMLNYVNGM
ncbi:hypothetical protein [Selenomonas ruminantium]|uniref:hypothetical protein n=1 Tax=Selenomonas ruminantium TaxID=971 RepID=UPI0026EC7FBC|nr:hypothetical protein [Selenomonas ruminantium]